MLSGERYINVELPTCPIGQAGRTDAFHWNIVKIFSDNVVTIQHA